jgi:caa(3)-type oxidase subunit IV
MHAEHEERFPNYILIWVILLLLTGSSIVASVLVKEFVPELHAVRVLLLLFLFTVGGIKALLVALNFMHLKFERKLLWALAGLALIFVGFFIAGTLIDITSTVKR